MTESSRPGPDPSARERESVVRLIRAPGLAATEYAYAATAPAGSRLVFLAGACPLDEHGATRFPGDLAGQAQACLENLEQALEAAGAHLEDVICTRVLVASDQRSDLVATWTVVGEAFGDHDVPSTLFGVTVLGYPGQLVELEAVAALPA